jgi:hypothetical protein
MTKKTVLLATVLLLGGPTAVLAKGHILPQDTPGVSDTYVFPGSASESDAALREDDTGGVASLRPILNRLESEGYTEISNLQPVLGGYTALAVKDGKVMQVSVDGASGKVTRVR